MLTRVSIVLDPDFGTKLESLIPDSYVWVCSSAQNDQAADLIWKRIQNRNYPDSILTTFQNPKNLLGAKLLMFILPTINEHHGWDVLDIYGLSFHADLQTIFGDESSSVELKSTDSGIQVTRRS